MTRGQLKAQMRFVQLKRLKRLQTGFVVAAVIFVAEVALSAVAVAKADDPGHHCRGGRVACIVPGFAAGTAVTTAYRQTSPPEKIRKT